MAGKRGVKRGRKTKYTQRSQQGHEQQEAPPGADLGGDSQSGQDIVIAPPARRGRGPNKTRDAPKGPQDTRPKLWPINAGEFRSDPPCTMIVSTIAKLAVRLMPGPIPTFHLWHDTAKQEFHDRFLDIYQWRDTEDANNCLEVLEYIASEGYGRELRNARLRCIRLHGWDTSKWKAMLPAWCKEPAHWHGLCDYWGTTEYKTISNRNKTNRCASGLTTAHFGGSRSASKLREVMAEGLGREPTDSEVYIEIHTQKEEVAVVDKRKRVVQEEGEDGQDASYEESESLVLDEVPTSTTTLNFANDKYKQTWERVEQMKKDQAYVNLPEKLLYKMATKEVNRGRTYGFGRKIDTIDIPAVIKRGRANHYADSTNSCVTQNTPQALCTEEINAVLQEQQRQFNEQNARKDEEHAQHTMHLTSLLTSVMAHVGMEIPAYLQLPPLVSSLLVYVITINIYFSSQFQKVVVGKIYNLVLVLSKWMSHNL